MPCTPRAHAVRMPPLSQASCLGLADLLPGRSWSELKPHFELLFTSLLRVLDDVKETVRKAALAGWRAVCGAAARLSDPASGSVSAEQALSVLGLMLPLLLESVTHNSAEVRALAAKQMLKLCETGGKHLSPHAVRLVPALLENLSVLEDQALNYLQQHAEAAGVSEQVGSASPYLRPPPTLSALLPPPEAWIRTSTSSNP